jgi:hypothetical protein
LIISWQLSALQSVGVRVYALKQGGDVRWMIGVASRFKLWWTLAFGMNDRGYHYYEDCHTLDKPSI